MRRGIPIVIVLAVIAATTVACAPPKGASSASSSPGEVVVYTSVDQVFAEPVLKDFEAKTGIKVRPVYDAEAAKTTGLVNRLVAEKSRPRADVWWSGETVQTLGLAEKGLLAPYASPSAGEIPANLHGAGGLWTGFGGRARVILVNTDAKPGREPAGLWHVGQSFAAGSTGRGSRDPRRVGMSNPVFGTASTQAAVLYAIWGRAKARDYYQRISAIGVTVLEGNGDVRDKVVSGELDWGLVDTDDALGAIEKGAPVRIIVPDQEEGGLGAILIPNTVGLVAGGPNAANGKRLLDYLLAAETEQRLVREGWIQFPVRGAADSRVASGTVKLAPIDWPKAYAQLGASAADMKEIFLK